MVGSGCDIDGSGRPGPDERSRNVYFSTRTTAMIRRAFIPPMRERSLFSEPWPRIIGIPILGTLMSFIHNEEPLHPLYWLKAIVITFLFWQSDYLIIQRLRLIWPGVKETGRRISVGVVTICLFNTALDFIICNVLLATGLDEQSEWASDMWLNVGRNLIPTLVVGTLYESGYLFYKWRAQAIEIEALKTRQLRTELDVLKNQVSPHFLFNSLNTLVTLIHEDPHQAERFTKDLSAVYRYILQHKEKEVVDLGTELDFTEAYIHLMKVRFEESLRITVNVAPEHRALLVAPLTLQLLLENALKHNVASLAHPLTVDIHVEEGRTLVVRNNLRQRQGTVDGTGTGLTNVKQRYAILSDRPVDVIETREHFLVALPLMELAAQVSRVE
jgi:hypothetical protein